jgi:protein O-GlcNAc transferase
LQEKGSGLTTGTDRDGRREILNTPEAIGPYIDLFCALARKTPAHHGGSRFMASAVSWMLVLDSPWIGGLVARYAALRASLKIDVAEHLRPLLDAVLVEQLRRDVDPVETPGQFLLRRDDPIIARDLAERVLERTRRRLGDAAWSEARRPRWTWTPARRLRVGYVCSDLAMHPVGLSIRTLLLNHDKARFEVFLYDRTPEPDRTVAGPVAMGADASRPCLELSSEAMEALVQNDGIDILVDLSGSVIGSGDTVFSRPSAPARVAMLGYPGAMGRRTVDYTVVDRAAVPDTERAGFGERLIVMPGSFLPLDDTFSVGEELPSRADLGLPPEAFVLAAFNRLEKVNIETLRMWVACLKAIPRSILWLASDAVKINEVMEALLERAGLSRDRLVVSARLSVLAHARRHGLADVSLDPVGYNGGYTTALSLQCGVPVVSRPGRCFAWRMSAGLLLRAGLSDCVVDTPAEYLAQVVRIAEDPHYALALRNKLMPRELGRALGTRRYVAALERAFLQIAEQGRQGKSPSDIVVEE